MSRLLAVDTSSRRLVVGVQHGDDCWGIDDDDGDMRHGLRLPATVNRCLADAGLRPSSLDAVIAGVGPGSFVGVRSGLAFAKSLAWSLDLPMLAVGSIDSIAWQAFAAEPEAVRAAVMIDARMQRCYRALVSRPAPGEVLRVSDDSLREEPLAAAETWLRSLPVEGTVAAGDGMALLTASAASGVALFCTMLPALLPDYRSMLSIGAARFARGEGLAADLLQPHYVRDRVALTEAQRRAGESL